MPSNKCLHMQMKLPNTCWINLNMRAGKHQDLVRWHQGSRRSLLHKLVGMTYGTHCDGIESQFNFCLFKSRKFSFPAWNICMFWFESCTCCRGGNGKCPVAIADLVLLHNKASDAQAKKDPIAVDVFDKIPDAKREFLKFCKPFEARLRRNVKTHRVIPQVEEQTMDIMIPGFIVDKSARGAKRLGPSKINLQFLEHHKENYLELHHDLAKISYSPQTDAAIGARDKHYWSSR